MTTAAIYCRVSDPKQEKEGTSLETQMEACLKYCKENGYEPTHKFSEQHSGLELQRPKLDALRELVRNKHIDIIVIHCLDRFSRDPTHGVILTQELEKHGVKLEAVTEDVDNSELGKLISYIRGFASKLEAEKIRERTMRGKRKVAELGKLPTGRGVFYGYSYDKARRMNIANDYLDIVRRAGMWILEEGIALNEVQRRLMAEGIPAPKGGLKWSRGTLGRIFTNPAYAGKSYVYRTVTIGDNDGRRRIRTTPDKLIEIPNAVDRTAFTWEEWLGIQAQLKKNRELSPRNQKLNYLLRGMVFCKQCGNKYYGVPMHGKPYYRCSAHNSLIHGIKCHNKTYSASRLEEYVWNKLSQRLQEPELILSEVQKVSGVDVSHLEEQVELNRRRLETFDEADTRNIRLYGAGLWTYEKLECETVRLRAEEAKVKDAIAELETQIGKAKEMTIHVEAITSLCATVKGLTASMAFAEKRDMLDALGIKVWVDGHSVQIEGVLPILEGDSVSLPS